MASVPISLPSFDAQPQDNLLQVLNSLSILESAISNVFGKISNRVQEERNKIHAFDSRIDNAKKKVTELSKTRFAVTITSPATFPEPLNVSSSKPLFEDFPAESNKVEEPRKLEVEPSPAPFEVRAAPKATASSYVVFEKAFQTKRKMKASRRSPMISQTSKLAVAPPSISSQTEENHPNLGFDEYQPIFTPLKPPTMTAYLPLQGIAVDVNFDWNPVAMDYSGIVPSFEELDGLDEPTHVITQSSKKEVALNNNSNINEACVLFLNRKQEPQKLVAVNQTSSVQLHPVATNINQQQLVQPIAINVTPDLRKESVKQDSTTAIQMTSHPIPKPIPLPQPTDTKYQAKDTLLPLEPEEERPSLGGLLSAIQSFDKNKLKSRTLESTRESTISNATTSSSRTQEPRRSAQPVTMQDQLRLAFARFRPAMRPEPESEEPDAETDRAWNSNDNNM